MEVFMISIEILEHIVKLVLYSAYLKDEEPLSLIIVAKPESGKTELLKQFRYNKGIAYKSDFTAYGLMRDVLPLIKSKKVYHIVCPDLLRPFSRRKSIVKDLITFLNSLIEEGIVDISTYFSPNITAIIQNTEFTDLKCGLITAITKDELYRHKDDWIRKGFLSRAIPFSYDYPTTIMMKIFKSITEEGYHDKEVLKLNFPKKQIKVELPKKISEKLLPYSLKYGELNRVFGFRFQKQFQVLLKCNVLKEIQENERKDNVVNGNDFTQITRILDYVNFEYNPLSE